MFSDEAHDHIGIVIGVGRDSIVTAEGNVGNTNVSAVVTRLRDGHIRAYIRLPDGFRYR